MLSSISRTQGQIVILSDLHLELSMSRANEIQFAYTFGLGNPSKDSTETDQVLQASEHSAATCELLAPHVVAVQEPNVPNTVSASTHLRVIQLQDFLKRGQVLISFRPGMIFQWVTSSWHYLPPLTRKQHISFLAVLKV